MIVLARCDDRLIHGQFMTVISKEYDADGVLTVEDETANNRILKRIYQMAVPKGMKSEVSNTEDAKEVLKEAIENTEKIILLMKKPQTYLELINNVEGLPKELNVGPMTRRPDTVKVNASIHLTNEEIEAVKGLDEKGIRVYFRQVPSQPTIEWADVKKNL